MFLPIDEPIIAKTRSFFGWRRVWLGTMFFELPMNERLAVIEHELAHCDKFHTEQRILCLIFAPFLFKWLCRRQEFIADNEAVKRGYGHALLQFLAKHQYDGKKFHPSSEALRIKIAIALSPSRTTSPDTA